MHRSTAISGLTLLTALAAFAAQPASAADSGADKTTTTKAAKANDAGKTNDGADSTSGKNGDSPSVFYLLVPIAQQGKDVSLKNGCWVRIFSEPNYTGDTLTLAGAVAMPNMKGPFGINWSDRVRSIEVGKRATVHFYDNENFRDQDKHFEPGQKVPNVSKQLGFFDDFRSMKMTCAKK